MRNILVCILLFPVLLFASTTRIWELKSQQDFLAGELKNISVSAEGEVRLSSEMKLLCETDELFLWSLTQDKAKNIYIGSGNEGKVFKVDRKGKIDLLYDSEEVGIQSLVLDKNNNLFAGTSPNGIIYKIDRKGKATEFFKTEDRYVWSLLFDRYGYLYAATGDRGKIYKIDKNGEGTIWYDSDEPHITHLILHDRNFYAGSSGNGLVYKISQNAEGRVIYDCDEEEIAAMVVDRKGVVYVGANPSEKKGMPSIYKIDSTGVASILWTVPDSLILSMELGSDGSLILGTGSKGNLYQLTENGDVTFLNRCEEKEILSILKSKEEIIFSTGNSGRVYLLSKGYSRSGETISKPYDTKTVSRWGKIDWDAALPAGTDMEFTTRTGNSESIDNTWSGWSSRYKKGESVKSPSARFIQWKAMLSSNGKKTAVLDRVSIAYLQTNLKPIINYIKIDNSGDNEEPFQQKNLEKGIRKIVWEAVDENGDSLIFNLYFKGEDEKTWKLFKEKLTESEYLLDTNFFPDGKYRIKVTASDIPSNPVNLAQKAEKISEVFQIDNTPPDVKISKIKKMNGDILLIEATVSDRGSIIKSCEYSINAGIWQVLAPKDNIFDSKEEKFSFKIDLSGKKGENLLVIKGEDLFDNKSSAKKIISN